MEDVRAGITRRGAIGTAAAAVVSACNTAGAKASHIIPGVPYVRGGEIFREGSLYRGIGCNYFNAINNTTRREDFQLLVDMEIPFSRINFGQFWSGTADRPGWNLYFDDKERWFGVLDEMVADAEAAGLGLLASMFWRIQSLPDLMKHRYGVRDSLSAWGFAESRTRSWMRQITAETVERYAGSPALWGWEMGNEIWASVYTPLYQGGGRVDRGSPATYEAYPSSDQATYGSDILTTSAATDALLDWAEVVSTADSSSRIRSSGSAGGSLWRDWNKIHLNNTAVTLDRENPPAAANVASCHIYTGTVHSPTEYHPTQPEFSRLLKNLSAVARSRSQPLLLGEFGAFGGHVNVPNSQLSDLEAEKLIFAAVLGGIMDAEVPLAVLWDFGRANYGGTPWGVATEPSRRYQLDAISHANREIRASLQAKRHPG